MSSLYLVQLSFLDAPIVNEDSMIRLRAFQLFPDAKKDGRWVLMDGSKRFGTLENNVVTFKNGRMNSHLRVGMFHKVGDVGYFFVHARDQANRLMGVARMAFGLGVQRGKMVVAHALDQPGNAFDHVPVFGRIQRLPQARATTRTERPATPATTQDAIVEDGCVG